LHSPSGLARHNFWDDGLLPEIASLTLAMTFLAWIPTSPALQAPLDDGFFVFLILSHFSLSLFFSFFFEFREFKNLFFNYSAKPEGHARMKFLLKFTFASPPT
jgi:hypothetical protein